MVSEGSDPTSATHRNIANPQTAIPNAQPQRLVLPSWRPRSGNNAEFTAMIDALHDALIDASIDPNVLEFEMPTLAQIAKSLSQVPKSQHSQLLLDAVAEFTTTGTLVYTNF